MIISHPLRMTLAFVAWFGVWLPVPNALAGEPGQVSSSGIDIRLDEQGSFVGRIVDPNGNPVAGMEVALHSQGQELSRQRTDATGQFVMTPGQGGSYQLVSETHQVPLRCWVTATAPPQARNQLQFVQGQVARGQSCTESSCTTPGCGPGCSGCDACGRGRGGGLGFLMNPIVIGAAIAAAIAIPLALSDDDDDDAS